MFSIVCGRRGEIKVCAQPGGDFAQLMDQTLLGALVCPTVVIIGDNVAAVCGMGGLRVRLSVDDDHGMLAFVVRVVVVTMVVMVVIVVWLMIIVIDFVGIICKVVVRMMIEFWVVAIVDHLIRGGVHHLARHGNLRLLFSRRCVVVLVR